MRKTLFALLVLFIASCSKNNDEIIKGNTPPPDGTIDSATIDIYINKVYVNLIGREPIGNEKAQASALLKQHNFSEVDRTQFLDAFFTKPEYNRNLYNIVRIEYLNNLDSMEIEGEIGLYEYLQTQPEYAAYYDVIEAELVRMHAMRTVVSDMNSGALDYRNMLKRCTYNYFYDQINMGAENYVVSTFQNYLFRYPTQSELENGKNMINGSNATLFLQIGNSKQDYTDIFFDSDDYYEGQARYLFIKYMFREPSSAEVSYYANIYKSSNNYKLLQKTFFATDEYAGLK